LLLLKYWHVYLRSLYYLLLWRWRHPHLLRWLRHRLLNLRHHRLLCWLHHLLLDRHSRRCPRRSRGIRTTTHKSSWASTGSSRGRRNPATKRLGRQTGILKHPLHEFLVSVSAMLKLRSVLHQMPKKLALKILILCLAHYDHMRSSMRIGL
jgi:hypothetical protein